MDLKFQLEKIQAKKASRLEDSLFSPMLFPHYQKVAETLSKSGVIPNAYRGKPEDVFVAIAMGYQLGFPVEQSLQDIAVINGRPCLWGVKLAESYSIGFGCRSLDVLHCAAARVLGASEFVTTDVRQKSLATAMGLNPVTF